MCSFVLFPWCVVLLLVVWIHWGVVGLGSVGWCFLMSHLSGLSQWTSEWKKTSSQDCTCSRVLFCLFVSLYSCLSCLFMLIVLTLVSSETKSCKCSPHLPTSFPGLFPWERGCPSACVPDWGYLSLYLFVCIRDRSEVRFACTLSNSCAGVMQFPIFACVCVLSACECMYANICSCEHA